MEHYNRYQQTRFRNIDDEWRQSVNQERQDIYNDNRRYYREHHYDPKHPSYPVPYAQNFEEELEPADSFGHYKDLGHYQIKRREFGHGQSGNLNPGRMESYGETSFRGFPGRPDIGRDYESNVGYRESYTKLDSRAGRESDDTSGRQQTGPHRGKGPRAYRKTDDRIMEDVNDRMCDNPYLDASDIEVGVKDGEVILTGTVEDREAKRMAADIAENVSGVENVENRLHVKLRGI